ncbi:hypothetical protein [Pseudomonas cichorii]|uniref:hypothetical protein n=1 Tax=Pseudomonas cichorii TaxID=36746 RepID=UPI001F4382FA|nr:hypothetical protein [Pseudomonas cichorii]
MALVLTNVIKLRKRGVLTLAAVAGVIFWYVTLPRVAVTYSKGGTTELRYIWNTQHRIDKGGLLPGQATSDIGSIFPDKDFFMMFDWWSEKGLRRCISITPTWGTTEINLDEAGKIDIAETPQDVIARLQRCEGARDPFRP